MSDPQTVPELDNLTAAIKTAWEAREKVHQAELTAAKVAYDAKHAEMKDQSAQRQAWRAEAWAWRTLAGVSHDKLTSLSPAEVAAKKFLGGSSTPAIPERGPWRAVWGLAIPTSLEPHVDGVLQWHALVQAGEVARRLNPTPGDLDRGRTLLDYTQGLSYNIYWLGHWDSLIALAELWTALLRADPNMFLDSIALETSIMAGLLKSSLFVLSKNAGADPRVDEAVVTLTGHIERFNLATAKLADKPLIHAALCEYVGYGADWLLNGHPDDKLKLDRLGAHIAADFNFVRAPDGEEVLVMAHGVQGLYLERTGRAEHDFAHWMTYLRTSMSMMEFGALMGLPLMTERAMRAVARALYWTLPTQGGPDAPTYAKDMGGGGLWAGSKQQRVVQFRDGTKVPGRWKITSFGEGQGVHSLQRGQTYAPAWRAPELHKTWVPELQTLDRKATHGRHAIRQALLTIEMGGQRL